MRRTKSLYGWGFVWLLVGVTVNLEAQSWSFIGSLQQARVYPSATLLPNGQVLVVGGYHRGLIVAVAELYNPRRAPSPQRAACTARVMGTAPAC